MGLLTWVLIGVIVLVAIGLGVGAFFTNMFEGAEIISEHPIVQNATERAEDLFNDTTESVTGISTFLSSITAG